MLLKKLLVVSLTLFFAVSNSASAQQDFAKSKVPLPFMENKGQIIDQHQQTNPAVLYQLALPGLNVSLKKDGFSYDTWMAEDLGEDQDLKDHRAIGDGPVPHKYNYKFHRIDVNFLGANPQCQIEALDRTPDYTMYYTSGTPEEGAKVHQYGRVLYRNLYPNIDLEFVAAPGTNKPVEYNFIVHPGADVAQIKMRYTGALDAALKNGALLMQLAHTTLTENIPASWIAETKQAVQVNYKQLTQDQQSITIGFTANNINSNNTLIIDPTPNLDWGTYYGGSGYDAGYGIATDASGNVLVTGVTNSSTAIATSGAHQTTYGGGNYDAFVVKFNPSGTRLWGTYYGGSGNDYGYGIATDASGNVLVTGETSSSTAIATSGAHQTAYGVPNRSVFVVKFNPSGTRLWGTYYGGSPWGVGYGIATDASGNILVTGVTMSSTAIATIGAHQITYGGGEFDAFVVKFNPSGTLLWGTFYGGSDYDYGYGIATDASGNVLVTGQTYSSTAIATIGAHQTAYGGGGYRDAFVVKFSPSGTRLWGTYYGGSGDDGGGAIATDASGNILVTGETSSFTAIATIGAHQTIFEDGYADAFVVKFSPSGTRLWGTYYGGTGFDIGDGIATDASGNVLVTGLTESSNAIATSDAHQTTYGGGGYVDGFVVKFTPSGTRLWGTYYNTGGAIATDASGNILVTGETSSSTAIATSGAHQTTNGGGADAFIAKFSDTGCNALLSSIMITQPTTCGLSNGALNGSASGGSGSYSYLWSNGATAANQQNLSAGTYTLTVTAGNGCTASSSATVNNSICPKVTTQSTVNNITQNTATVSWPAVSCAAKYRVVVKNVGTGTQTTTIVAAPNTSLNLSSLQPNTTYQVRIRTQCSQNGTVVSQLSPIKSFTTLNNQGIQCLPPANVSVSNITTTSAQINWTLLSGAIQYNLRYRKVGTSPWTTIVLSGTANTTTLQNLTASGSYEFQIRSKCNSNPDEFSPYSSLLNFNTLNNSNGIIQSLNCSSARNIGTMTNGFTVTGASSRVPYTGGNGGIYQAQTINSTGVTGLTATITAGNFVFGSDSITVNISGTPSAAGTASFSINIGGQTCNLSRTVSLYSFYCVGPSLINPLNTTQTTATINILPNPLTIQSEIRYRQTGTANWSDIIILPGSTSSITLQNLNPGTNYQFQLRGLCDDNPVEYSGWSNHYFNTVSTGVISSLNCINGYTSDVNNYGTLSQNIVLSGVYSVLSYSGGNGGSYNGDTVSSTGVTGLTASLSPGSFSTGTGTLTYNITGTPVGCGIAYFPISIGGQSCTLSRTVVCSDCSSSSTVTDADGNVYPVVQIGNQCWMASNLRVTQDIYGDPIEYINNSNAWSTCGNPQFNEYTYPANNPNTDIYLGKLYDIGVIESGVCPSGWREPFDNDWKQLIGFLDNGFNPNASVNEPMSSSAGYKLKSTKIFPTDAPSFPYGWLISGNAYLNTNSSGFSALPAGDINMTGEWGGLYERAIFWTSSLEYTNNSYYSYIFYALGSNGEVYRGTQADDYDCISSNTHGFSIRCIRNGLPGAGGRIFNEMDQLNNSKRSGINIYPNPTNNNINVVINAVGETQTTIRITDLLGRILLTETEELIGGNNTITYNISDYAAGVYLIHVGNGNTQQVFKVVKE